MIFCSWQLIILFVKIETKFSYKYEGISIFDGERSNVLNKKSTYRKCNLKNKVKVENQACCMSTVMHLAFSLLPAPNVRHMRYSICIINWSATVGKVGQKLAKDTQTKAKQRERLLWKNLKISTLYISGSCGLSIALLQNKVEMSGLIWTSQHRSWVLDLPLFFKLAWIKRFWLL